VVIFGDLDGRDGHLPVLDERRVEEAGRETLSVLIGVDLVLYGVAHSSPRV